MATVTDSIQPPRNRVGRLDWLRANLFNSIGNSLLTLSILAVGVFATVGIVDWVLHRAAWGVVTDNLRLAEQMMQQAARDFARGEAESGQAQQRDAQRLLENADPGKPSDGDGDGQNDGDESERMDGDEDGDGRSAAFGGGVPAAEGQNKAEAFRRRVLRNLGDSPVGRLSPAVKRYAEGLLR